MEGRNIAYPSGRGYLTPEDRSAMLKGLEGVARGSAITPLNVETYKKKLRGESQRKNEVEKAKDEQKIKWMESRFKSPGK